MGLDFTEKCAPAWTRGWDREKNQLEQVTLFTSFDVELDRTFRARPSDGSSFITGTNVLLFVERDTIYVAEGTNTIGRSIKASQSMVEAISSNGGKVAAGVVGNVAPITGSAEIRIIH